MSRRAFTLVELLVVIAIVGLLSMVAVIALDSSRIKGRNAKRKADLIQISKALELYYADNGSYPNTGAPVGSYYWGACPSGGGRADSGAGAWIPNLAPAYTAVLPRDPTHLHNQGPTSIGCSDNWACYIYMSDGQDYKVAAHCTPEGPSAYAASEYFVDPGRTSWAWAIYTPGAKIINMKRPAFTLVELLVVIAIIGLLSTVAVVALGSTSINARNTKRKADMIQMSKALELYYADHDAYPVVDVGAMWHGACSYFGSYPDVYVDAAHDAWIPGLTPTYMASLPHDPLTNKLNPNSPSSACRTDPQYTCFGYKSDGDDYKIIAHCLPEGSTLSSDPFAFQNPGYLDYIWQIATPGGVNW